jgi:fumarate reductase flavoprotein subunit
VAVVEQGTDARYPCNSRYSGGILHFAYHDVRSSPDVLAAAATKALGEDANSRLIHAAAEATGRALDWLSRFDVRFVKSSPVSWHRWTLAPPRPLRPGLDFPGSGPDRLLVLLSDAIEAGGGEIFHGLRAVDLEREEEQWTVIADGEAGTRTSAPVPSSLPTAGSRAMRSWFGAMYPNAPISSCSAAPARAEDLPCAWPSGSAAA